MIRTDVRFGPLKAKMGKDRARVKLVTRLSSRVTVEAVRGRVREENFRVTTKVGKDKIRITIWSDDKKTTSYRIMCLRLYAGGKNNGCTEFNG